MRRYNKLRIRALEERRKPNFNTTSTYPKNKQKKKVAQENGNKIHYPKLRMCGDGFRNDFFEDYNRFCNPFDCESYDDFCNPFNYIGSNDSDSDSFFDDEDEGNSQGFEDVDIEALEQEVDESSGVMLNLPMDIFLDILSRLSIRPLARCRCVCKTWRKVVHHPRFTSMHHTRVLQLQDHYNYDSSTSLVLHSRFSGDELRSDIYMLEHDICEIPDDVMIAKPQFFPSNFEFEVVGSCNGLLCLSEQSNCDPIYVCNPVIGEYVKIPEASKCTNDIIPGFGYDQVSNEYKVIRMLFDSIEYVSEAEGNVSFKLEAEVYTLGSGLWRKLEDVPYPLRSRSSSVFVCGALHWMTDDYIGLSVSELIISFDVHREDFRPVPPPPGFHFDSESFRFRLGDLRRCLCLFDYSSNDRFDIWAMKDYGVRNSWTKEYVISRQQLGFDKFFLCPLKVLHNGEILLVHNHESLVCYDPNRKRVRGLGAYELPPKFEAFIHVGSFVSLKDIIGPTTSRRSVNNRKWYRTMHPLPSHNPELDIEDWILDYEVQQLASFLDSGVDLSDLYHDW